MHKTQTSNASDIDGNARGSRAEKNCKITHQVKKKKKKYLLTTKLPSYQISSIYKSQNIHIYGQGR